MKAINWREIQHAYVRFTIDFMLLLGVVCFVMFSYFFSEGKVYEHLESETQRMEKVRTIRLSIIHDFDFVVTRLKQLARFGGTSVEEVNSQRLIIGDVQLANKRIQANIDAAGLEWPSFEVYKKICDDVALNVRVTDSLFKSYYELEKVRAALINCVEVNQKAKEKNADKRLMK